MNLLTHIRALQPNLFASDNALQACAANKSAHVTRGAFGPHVRKIQAALIYLDGLSIDQSEVETGRYGPSTAPAVLAFKKARHIVNRAYQTQEDDIVGIMTVAAMDRELREREIVPAQSLPHPRLRRCQCVGDGHPQQFLATVALRAGVRCQKTTVDFRRQPTRRAQRTSFTECSKATLGETDNAQKIPLFGGSESHFHGGERFRAVPCPSHLRVVGLGDSAEFFH